MHRPGIEPSPRCILPPEPPMRRLRVFFTLSFTLQSLDCTQRNLVPKQNKIASAGNRTEPPRNEASILPLNHRCDGCTCCFTLSFTLQSLDCTLVPKQNKNCIGRESNPGRPRGRRAFYHRTTDATVARVLHAPSHCNRSTASKEI
ncbi:hypothetical protein TNIN_472881 [Trichonephila inaurata madagascariensis]|uniref:Uncharacterized protein n=1 Tax=Trichonephila inaurata madagascariensis TaxID=2747483 RepID=A0A8X6MJX5_9ARAC|nr:hypothetical protein TNIN_472881 [Trichonephila inaurata madagascariensis]